MFDPGGGADVCVGGDGDDALRLARRRLGGQQRAGAAARRRCWRAVRHPGRGALPPPSALPLARRRALPLRAHAGRRGARAPGLVAHLHDDRTALRRSAPPDPRSRLAAAMLGGAVGASLGCFLMTTLYALTYFVAGEKTTRVGLTVSSHTTVSVRPSTKTRTSQRHLSSKPVLVKMGESTPHPVHRIRTSQADLANPPPPPVQQICTGQAGQATPAPPPVHRTCTGQAGPPTPAEHHQQL
ncbi:hypothetical protein U1Q18_051648 [Sarracenia purpurea var. burkii]